METSELPARLPTAAAVASSGELREYTADCLFPLLPLASPCCPFDHACPPLPVQPRPCPGTANPGTHSAWISPKETKQLSSKSIDAYLSDTGKKNGKLKEAYTIAKDPAEWEADQEKRQANGDFDRQDDEEDEDVDMLDEDGEEKPAGSKKRKRSAAADKKAKEPASKAKKETGAAAKKRKVRCGQINACIPAIGDAG